MSQENAKLMDFNGTATEVKNLTDVAKMTQEVLKKECNINITLAEAIPTIVGKFLTCAGEFLEKNKSKDDDVYINILNIIELGVTYRESEDGEKTGNFTPSCQAGTILKTIIKSDEVTEDEE